MSFLERSHQWLRGNPSPEELLKAYRALLRCKRPDVTQEELEATQDLISEAAQEAGVSIEALLAAEEESTVPVAPTNAPPARAVVGTLDTSPLVDFSETVSVRMSFEEKRKVFDGLKRSLATTSQGAA